VLCHFLSINSVVTSEEFRQFFEQYGTVLDSVVMFDRITTRSRGFGFVTFEDYAVGQQLVKLGHVPMRNNKFVEIKPAEPKGSPNMNQNHPASLRYHRPSPPYHPPNGRGNFGGTTTAVSIMGEATTTTGMDPSISAAWVPTIQVATTPTRVTFPPPFYPSPTMMMNHSSMAASPITETTTILNANGGGMCMDMPSAPPFMMPYPMYQSYEGAYPSVIGPTSAPPLYSAPLYDMYAAPGYTASFIYEAAPMAPGTPTSYEAPWFNSNVVEENATPSEEKDVDRSS
jgi:RNA recognition motif. (a.k.a. RRM, RBD, or RNP domain)